MHYKTCIITIIIQYNYNNIYHIIIQYNYMYYKSLLTKRFVKNFCEFVIICEQNLCSLLENKDFESTYR